MSDLLFDRAPASNGNVVFGDDASTDTGSGGGTVITETPYTPDPALLFKDAGSATADLVFALEQSESSTGQDSSLAAAFALPAPSVAVSITRKWPVAVAFSVDDTPTVSVGAIYVSGAARPVAAATHAEWQAGQAQQTGTHARHQEAVRMPTGAHPSWQWGAPTPSRANLGWQIAIATPGATVTGWQVGVAARSGSGVRWQEGVISRASAVTGWQEATPAVAGEAFRWQEGVWTRNAATARYQQALRHSGRWHIAGVRTAKQVELGIIARHQEAWLPRIGTSILKPVTPTGPCYTPSGALLFIGAPGDGNLVFVCDKANGGGSGGGGNGNGTGETVVVPVKRVYVVLNSASLRRVDNNTAIPVFSMSMSLDVDSWTWSFSAQIPMQAQDAVRSTEPIEVEALVNGVPYRFLIESLQRARSFGQMPMLTATGRGKSALLDAPYAPSMSFTNDGDTTAQALMASVLTLNGVSIGWDIDWNLTDWNIPDGVFAQQGSYIDALNAIAAAAGAYIQPVPVDQTLRVLHRYTEAPWNWATAITPDYELPSAVTTQESIAWSVNPSYNRVFVSGTTQGVLGQYTRTGTAGDLLAETVTDALITAVDAARQRGRAVIGAGGPIATVGLKLPVLSSTGIIVPGKYVKYTDNGTDRLGVVRGVSVDVGLPEIWQTVTVEVHE